MPETKIRIEQDYFLADLKGEGWGILYAFPIQDLANGASLQRLMNIKVRKTLKADGWRVPEGELKSAARQAVKDLRAVIEPYFASRGIGNR